MKITALDVIPLKLPINKPMRTRYFNYTQIEVLALLLHTDEDITGHGILFSAGLNSSNSLKIYIQDVFFPLLIDEDPLNSSKIWQKIWLPNRNRLQGGVSLYALGAIDIALWDIKAKYQKLPLYKVFSKEEPKPLIYGSGGWLTMTDNELLEDCIWYLERGVNHYKVRIGSANDEARLKLIKKEFGDKIILYADANQYYSNLDSAINASKILENYGVKWFEEPLFSNSISLLQSLSQKINIPIATGENLSSYDMFIDVIALKAAKILQPDVIHCGGITEFLRIAKLISNSNIIMSTHLLHELSISLSVLCEKSMVEHIDLFPDDLFTQKFNLLDGKIALQHSSGTGVEFEKEALLKYSKS